MKLTESQLKTLKAACEASGPFYVHPEYKPARKLARFGLVTLRENGFYRMYVEPTEKGRSELANRP